MATDINNGGSPRRVTVDMLRWYKSEFGLGDDITFMAYHLGGAVVQYLLGKEWMYRHVCGETSPTDFFRNARRTNEEASIGARRLIDLGEMMFNLQDVENFDHCISQLVNQPKIEPTFAELEVGKVLTIFNVPFRFVRPSGSAGSDYDLEIFFADGRRAFCDTKCKLESTEISESSVRNSLETARKQLPKNLPGIVFLKLPQNWYTEEGTETANAAVASFFKSTRRVIAVKVYFTLIDIDVGSSMIWQNIAGREFRNEHPDLTDWGDVNIFGDPHPGLSVGPNWFQLHQL